MGKVNIENKLKDLLAFLTSYIEENGFPPSVREICSKLSIKSTATANYYIERLCQMGYIKKNQNKKRTICLVSPAKPASITVPVIGKVTAGQPILAYESYDEYMPLPVSVFGNEYEDLFMLDVKGDSMIEAGINDRDKIIVRRQSNAENGDIIVALIDDSATVKRFFKRSNKIILHPENSTMQDMEFDTITVLGKVVGLIRKY